MLSHEVASLLPVSARLKELKQRSSSPILQRAKRRTYKVVGESVKRDRQKHVRFTFRYLLLVTSVD